MSQNLDQDHVLLLTMRESIHLYIFLSLQLHITDQTEVVVEVEVGAEVGAEVEMVIEEENNDDQDHQEDNIEKFI